MITQDERRKIYGYLRARGISYPLARKACLLAHYHGKTLQMWHSLTQQQLIAMGFSHGEVSRLTGKPFKVEEEKIDVSNQKTATLFKRLKTLLQIKS